VDEHPHAAITCHGISKYFGGVRALHHVSLQVTPGRVTCLVGENGAGKSTLVRILTGVDRPDEGELWIGEDQVADLTPRRALELGIEAVYQNLALCENLDAAANVTLGREPTRLRIGPIRIVDKVKAAELAQARMAEIGVRIPDMTRPVRLFSGGQRQGIAIARATLRGHRLILFDEPTAALGVSQSEATLDLIRNVAAQGVAAVMISHNLDEVFAVADHVVALRHGTVVLDAALGSTSRHEVLAAMAGLSMDPSS
jgi:ABC-type sugar transport system ATPase subunit